MSDRSLTINGLIGAIALPALVVFGFSEGCANEIWTVLAPLPGALVAWYGRVRMGDITLLGGRKK